MATTAKGIRYPVATDPFAPHVDMQEVAEDVDAYLDRQHAEFTNPTNQAVANASAWGTGALTLDAAMSTTPAIATPGATDTIVIVNAGIYAITFSGIYDTVLAGRSFFSILVGSAIPARSGIAAGEDTGVVSIPNLRCTAGMVVQFQTFQSSGATRFLNARIRVTKVNA